MTLGAIIDVAVGLIFTYMLLSLIVSAVQEILAGMLQSRAANLRAGMAAILSLAAPGKQPAKTEAAAKTGETAKAAAPAVTSLFDQVYYHAMVFPCPTAKPPSYVSSRNFSTALFDVLRDGSAEPLMTQLQKAIAALPSSRVKQTLTALLVEAGDDVDQFRRRIEVWYDEAMDRVGGLYRRNAQLTAFAVGLVVAVGGNVDSIRLASALWTDPAIRAAVAAQGGAVGGAIPGLGGVGAALGAAGATATAATPPATPKTPAEILAETEKTKALLDSLPIPMGWRTKTVTAGTDQQCTDNGQAAGCLISMETAVPLPHDVSSWFWKIVGWLVTALAVSLGAPFWFDLLNRLISMRASGPKPARAAAATTAAQGSTG